jgi:hypothetical protein
MTVVRSVNYSLQRASSRLKGKKRAKPIAQAAEEFVCRGLGIVQDGEMVTELAMQELGRRFEGEVPPHVLQAMRALFQVGSQEDDAVDDALLSHGGAAGLELGVEGDDGLDAAV